MLAPSFAESERACIRHDQLACQELFSSSESLRAGPETLSVEIDEEKAVPSCLRDAIKKECSHKQESFAQRRKDAKKARKGAEL